MEATTAFRESEMSTSISRTVSAIVPCFNTGRLLIDAVDSISSQTDANYLHEIILVDDGSTDPSTLSALSELEKRPLVRLLANSRRKGPAGARNTGAFAAKGQWLAFLDGDDLWLSDSLSARLRALAEYPSARFFAGDFQIWYADTNKIEDNFFRTRYFPAKYYDQAYSSSKPVLLQHPSREMLSTSLCHSCSVMISKDLFIEVGGYEESLLYKEDHHLWYKLSKQADLVLIPQSLFLYRQHSKNMTNRECSPFEYEKAMLDFISRSEDPVLYPEILADRYVSGYVENSAWHRRRGAFIDAIRDASNGLKYAPFSSAIWRQLAAALLRHK